MRARSNSPSPAQRQVQAGAPKSKFLSVSGTQYWFQVCAIRAAGPSAWSDPATKRAT